MKMILKIARKELQLLFYSPVAWFLLVVFVVQTGLLFVDKYEIFLKRNEFEGGWQIACSSSVFVRGLWGLVSNYLYYYIPLLTMGLVSRELSSGSIKLLYSSPLTNTQIILGKFVSMVIYALVMSGILLLYVFVAWGTIQDFEWQAILTGLLGLFLLTCTYVAVGIFISSLTSYQFVAAVGTFLVLMFLSMVNGWGQQFDFVRDVTWWLSINGRASTFISGMICSEDLLYFPIVTALFLALTIIRLVAVRQKVKFAVTFGRNIGVIFLACLLGYFSSRPKLMAYYDATSNKRNTLTQASQDVVAELEGDVTVTAYVNIMSSLYNYMSYPTFIMRNRELFKMYERFKPEMKLKVVYYYDELTPEDGVSYKDYVYLRETNPGRSLWDLAREKCERWSVDSNMLKKPEEMEKIIDLTGERNCCWHIERESGESTFLRMYALDPMSPFPSEAEITAAFKRVTEGAPKIGAVTGYGMRSMFDNAPRQYGVATMKDYRHSLLNQGFDVENIDLHQPVPEDVDILIIADVRIPFEPIELENLKTFVEYGGNMYVLGEPRRREIMNPFLLDILGLELTEGTLVQYEFPWLNPDVLYSLITPEAKLLSFYYAMATYVMMPTTAGLEQKLDKGFQVTPLLRTDTLTMDEKTKTMKVCRVWNEMESLDYCDDPLTFNPEAGEKCKDYYPALILTRSVNGKEQRIVVTGDADCISNGELEQQRSPTNFVMLLGTFHYLSYNKMPVDVRRMESSDNVVHLNRAVYNVIHVSFVYILPLLFLGAGLFLWLKRRGR